MILLLILLPILTGRLSIENALPANKGEPRLVYLSLDPAAKDDKKKDDKKSKKKPELTFDRWLFQISFTYVF